MENQIIITENELAQTSQHLEHVIIYGNRALTTILLRYYMQNNLDSRVLGLSYIKTKTEETTFLNKPLKPIASYPADESYSVYVLGNNTKQMDCMLSKLSGWKPSQIIQVNYDLLASLSQRDNIPLDFVCVGFTKCGTTSLHNALNKNKQVYLPKRKELMYGRWKNLYIDAPERFQQVYYNNNETDPGNRKLGSIEPTFFYQSNFVYETYGTKPKVLFLVRNPVSATYSYFMMMMKQGHKSNMMPRLQSYYKKYRKFTPDIFHDFINDFVYSGKDLRFCYTKWIHEYLRFYDPESIKIIFFEDLIQDTENTMNEIQDFIGIEARKYGKLPHANSGNRVSRNYLCARINSKLQKLRISLKSTSYWKQTMALRFFEFVQKFTLVDTDVKMSETDRLELEKFYNDSVRELEQMTNRDLKDIWY